MAYLLEVHRAPRACVLALEGLTKERVERFLHVVERVMASRDVERNYPFHALDEFTLLVTRKRHIQHVWVRPGIRQFPEVRPRLEQPHGQRHVQQIHLPTEEFLSRLPDDPESD